jgi:hypothetical protein
MLQFLKTMAVVVVAGLMTVGAAAKAEDPAMTRIVNILEGMDKRLDKHESMLGNHESRLTHVESRLSSLEGKYGGGFSPYGPCAPAGGMTAHRRVYVPVRIVWDD